MTVFGYTAPVAATARNAKPAPTGQEYAQVDAQSCAGPSAANSVGPADFVLQLSSGGQVGPRLNVRDPALYQNRLQAGACIRGFITFQIPAGTTGSLVIYLPSGAAWQVG